MVESLVKVSFFMLFTWTKSFVRVATPPMVSEKMAAFLAKTLLEMIFPRERQVAPRESVDAGSR